MKLHKKGVLENLSALGVGLAGFLLIMAVTFLVMANVSTQVDADSGAAGRSCTLGNGTYAQNATCSLTSAAATIPGWVPLIIVVAIGGLILFMVRRFGK